MNDYLENTQSNVKIVIRIRNHPGSEKDRTIETEESVRRADKSTGVQTTKNSRVNTSFGRTISMNSSVNKSKSRSKSPNDLSKYKKTI